MSLLTRLTPHLVISVTVYSAEPALGSQGQLVDQIYPQGNQNDPVNAYKFSKFAYKFSTFGAYNIEASLMRTMLKLSCPLTNLLDSGLLLVTPLVPV